MCGRYDNSIAAEAYRRLFGAERLPQSNFPPRYNVAPTDRLLIIGLGQDGHSGVRSSRALRPCPAEMLENYPLSRIVNSPRNDVPECIEPLAQERRDG